MICSFSAVFLRISYLNVLKYIFFLFLTFCFSSKSPASLILFPVIQDFSYHKCSGKLPECFLVYIAAHLRCFCILQFDFFVWTVLPVWAVLLADVFLQSVLFTFLVHP